MNPATLDYQFGRPGRRADYLIERIGHEWRFTLDGDDPDGKPMHFTYDGPVDSKDRAIEGRPGDTLQLTLIHSRTIESVLKTNGKVADRWRRVISPDGRTMTITQYGTKPKHAGLQQHEYLRKAVGFLIV